jgi:hypothetical protein
MNKVFQIQQLVFSVLQNNVYLKNNNIPIINYTYNKAQYPFVQVVGLVKTTQDDFNDLISISINILSNKNTPQEVIEISDQIELSFKDKNLLLKPYLQNNQQIQILNSILGYQVVKTSVYQNQDANFISSVELCFSC